MDIINFIKSLFLNTNNNKIEDNNSEKEQYYLRKKELEETAIADTVFWDKIDLSQFNKEKCFYETWTCPYCKEKLPDRKGTSFKCINCKKKIYKKHLILSDTYGIFREEDKGIIEDYWNIFLEHKKFLEIWDGINKRLPEIVPTVFDADKTKNIQLILMRMRLGHISYYERKNLNKLRDCRFTEGQLQQLFGTISQATNCFMQCLFIDLMGDYNTLYDDKEIKEELIEKLKIEKENIKIAVKNQKEEIKYYKKLAKLQGSYFNKSDYEYDSPKIDESLLEWMNVGKFIAPGIYNSAFSENLSIEEFEKIFKFNAKNVIKNVRYAVPITPDEAWEKIKNYREENKHEKEY